MHALASFTAASLLLSSVSAVPNLRRRTTTSALDAWVTVDDEGQPSTVTPQVTTVDGTATTISPAPNDVTATVFTQTSMGRVTTTTGTTPAIPTATSGAAGDFPVCHNLDGEFAPWCSPTNGTKLYPGTTYYFIWDPDYFAQPNTTVIIQGNYVNETTGNITDQAFESSKTTAAWGFWSYKVEDSLLKYQAAKNITIQLASVAPGKKATIMKGPTVEVNRLASYTPDTGGSPDLKALYIALPTVLGFVILCVIGTCLWNRNQRRIGVGNIMSRGRHGYGVGKSARSRMGMGKRQEKGNERIQLMQREMETDGVEPYRDAPAQAPTQAPDRPRRDSDALGSLAGTPTEDRRMDFNHPGRQPGGGNGNYFRDELRRQNDERF
ncbi:hypothetical protein F4775DRAFT_568883 [Biscogniauxia sp. FL1348]|nr:hypothetical protein F4775DRAFT_568883 [Biscogniauxia sp. FL1348]